jgi:MFS family permease
MMNMRHYKRVPIVGLVFGVGALALMAWQPVLPLAIAIALMAVVGFAVGTVFPVCTVSIQNAVPHHQVGVAMGAMNFFRALASAFAVAIMGAIILAGVGVTPQHGTGVGPTMVAATATGGIDRGFVFRWVFAAGAAFLAAALATLIMMEERRLRGRADASAIQPAE